MAVAAEELDVGVAFVRPNLVATIELIIKRTNLRHPSMMMMMMMMVVVVVMMVMMVMMMVITIITMMTTTTIIVTSSFPFGAGRYHSTSLYPDLYYAFHFPPSFNPYVWMSVHLFLFAHLIRNKCFFI